MHSKLTVRYYCDKHLLSGNSYYFKEELITFSSWSDPSSLQWGRRRPITKRTYEMRKRQGYQCHIFKIKRPPAKVIPFGQKNRLKEG